MKNIDVLHNYYHQNIFSTIIFDTFISLNMFYLMLQEENINFTGHIDQQIL